MSWWLIRRDLISSYGIEAGEKTSRIKLSFAVAKQTRDFLTLFSPMLERSSNNHVSPNMSFLSNPSLREGAKIVLAYFALLNAPLPTAEPTEAGATRFLAKISRFALISRMCCTASDCCLGEGMAWKQVCKKNE